MEKAVGPIALAQGNALLPHCSTEDLGIQLSDGDSIFIGKTGERSVSTDYMPASLSCEARMDDASVFASSGIEFSFAEDFFQSPDQIQLQGLPLSTAKVLNVTSSDTEVLIPLDTRTSSTMPDKKVLKFLENINSH